MNLKIYLIRHTIIAPNVCILYEMSISITFYIQIQYLNILLNMTWHGGFYKCRRYYRWNPAVHNLRVLHGHRLKWTYISLDDSSIFYTLNDGAIDTNQDQLPFDHLSYLSIQIFTIHTFDQKVI